MTIKRKHAIWVMAVCLTLFISCLYILSLPRDTFALGIQVNGGQLGIKVSPNQALFNVSNMAPGWQGSARLDVSNAGQGSFTYSLRTVLNSGDQTLLNALILNLKDSRGNTLYNSSLGNLQNLQLGTLSQGADAGFAFTVTFPSNLGNQYQGLVSSVNFLFTAAAPESGGGGWPVPTVQTIAASAVTSSSAALNGSITSNGGAVIAQYGFFWGSNANSLSNTVKVGTDNHTGIFQANISDLTAGAVYYFQAYARDANGVYEGDVVQFTALEGMPPPPVPAPIFIDVPPTYWAGGAIGNLNGLGDVSGYPDGTFRPDNQITRAEVATIMDKVLNLTPYTPQASTFRDVNPADWFYQAVETADHAGIEIGCNDGAFHPNSLISRQEMACVLVQALDKSQLADSDAQAVIGFVDDRDIAWWSRGYIYVALQQGIISGYPDNTFRPRAYATRAEACAMISNFLGVHS
jgi:hypothetical protein